MSSYELTTASIVVTVTGEKLLPTSIYAPEEPHLRAAFFKRIRHLITGTSIIGTDANCVPDVSIDVQCAAGVASMGASTSPVTSNSVSAALPCSMDRPGPLQSCSSSHCSNSSGVPSDPMNPCMLMTAMLPRVGDPCSAAGRESAEAEAPPPFPDGLLVRRSLSFMFCSDETVGCA